MKNFPYLELQNLITISLKEDLKNIGDISTIPLFNPDDKTNAILVSKDKGIFVGSKVISRFFSSHFFKNVQIKIYKKDSDIINKGDLIADFIGQTDEIFKAERSLLNIIAFLSGIATQTNKFVKIAKNFGKAKILDTRKTLPGWRSLSKYAVRCGGGQNHRMGLYDMVLLKDNHIDSGGGILKTVEAIRTKWKNKFKIELEARTIKEVHQALFAKVDCILLDNMQSTTLNQAVNLINGETKIEVSGNVTLKKIPRIASTGVDYISVGSLTHSVRAFDFSLKIKQK